MQSLPGLNERSRGTQRECGSRQAQRYMYMYVYDVAVEDEYQQDQFQSAFERVSLTGI